MTPQFELALAAIAPLSPSERQQLVQILTTDTTVDLAADLARRNHQFRQGISLEQLRSEQPPKRVETLDELTADFWPEVDEIETFLAFLKQQRQAAG